MSYLKIRKDGTENMNNPEIDDFGTRYWRNNKRQMHRENGPAIEWEDGSKSWWFNGERHREGGPAIEYSSGHREWYINGKVHREDGPAIECNDGRKIWWYNGEFIGDSDCGFTQEDFERYLKIKEYW